MSRILKRPMFRIGGSANEEGIMNMAVPKRAGYQEPTGAATTLDNYKIDPNDPLFKEAMRNAAIMNQFAGAGKSRDSRLSDLLIRGGLRTLSERPAGNIFATVGRAFTPAVDEYLKGEDTEESFQRQLRLAGLTSAMTAQENREKYKKELELAGQKVEQGEKELFLKTSGLGAKGYGVWETLTGLKKAGENDENISNIFGLFVSPHNWLGSLLSEIAKMSRRIYYFLYFFVEICRLNFATGENPNLTMFSKKYCFFLTSHYCIACTALLLIHTHLR